MFQAVSTPDGGMTAWNRYWGPRKAAFKAAREQKKADREKARKEREQAKQERVRLRNEQQEDTKKKHKHRGQKKHRFYRHPYYVRDRNDPRTKAFIQRMLCRDHFRCRKCGSGDNLIVHHIQWWSTHPNCRLDPRNVVTLCGECHAKYHDWLPESDCQRHLRAIAVAS